MSSEVQSFLRRGRPEIEAIDSAYEQLKTIFPSARIEKNKKIKTRHVPSVLVDLVVQLSDDQLIIFEIVYISPKSTLSYSEYPSIAVLKDTLTEVAATPPPLLIVLATGHVDDTVKGFFENSGIPVVPLASNPAATRSSLREALERQRIYIPELFEDEEYLAESESDGFGGPADESWWKKLKNALSNPLIALQIFLVATVALLLAAKDKVWMAEFFILATVVLGGFIFSWKNRRRPSCINPKLIIEKDQRKLMVENDRWILERDILFKARGRVNGYQFRMDWTGSSNDIDIDCGAYDGEIVKKYLVKSEALKKQLWELQFDRPMRKGETRKVALRCVLPDPQHKAAHYHAILYKNVWDCKEFECRLSLSDDLEPNAVYFVYGTDMDVPLRKIKLSPDLASHEYVVHERPAANLKYSLEWELKDKPASKKKHGL